MKTLVETVDRKAVVKVDGRIDTLTAPELDKVVQGVIANNQTQIVLDLSKVDYISSTGFRVFIMAQKKTKPQGGQVILMGVSDEIKEIFEISGFTHLFTFAENLESSLASF